MDYEQHEYLERRSRALEDKRLALNSLCGRCRRAHIFRRARQLAITVHCTSLGHEVPADIVECSRYEDPRHLQLWEMRQIAHEIDPRRGPDDGSYL